MEKDIRGIHHITSIAKDPQENYDFYTKVLGLRLVKKTVNFDSPSTYHLYFGDKEGKPGTVITFFPTPKGVKGTIGGGQVGITSYAVPQNSLEFWKKRLKDKDVNYNEEERFDDKILSFTDRDGLKLEIIERKEGENSKWEFEDINQDKAIKGFAGAVLNSYVPEETEKLLVEAFGFEKIGENDEYIRLKSKADIGNIIDLRKAVADRGTTGIGVVHHIAFSTKDLETQIAWKERLEDLAYNVTDIRDRNYFTSIYFREKGGILFEIATEGPGFTRDEDINELGEDLKLPEQYEERRKDLERELIPINN